MFNRPSNLRVRGIWYLKHFGAWVLLTTHSLPVPCMEIHLHSNARTHSCLTWWLQSSMSMSADTGVKKPLPKLFRSLALEADFSLMTLS